MEKKRPPAAIVLFCRLKQKVCSIHYPYLLSDLTLKPLHTLFGIMSKSKTSRMRIIISIITCLVLNLNYPPPSPLLFSWSPSSGRHIYDNSKSHLEASNCWSASDQQFTLMLMHYQSSLRAPFAEDMNAFNTYYCFAVFSVANSGCRSAYIHDM